MACWWEGIRERPGRAASAPRTAAALQALSPKSFLGMIRLAAFFQGFPPTVSPGIWGNSGRWFLPSQSNKNSQEFQIPFTEGLSLSLVFASRQTLRSPHKWPVLLPGALAPLHRVCKYMGVGKGREHGECTQFPSPPPPTHPGPRQGLCSKPTCPPPAPWSWQPERPE